MKFAKSLNSYENTWPNQDLKFLRVLIKNNPIGDSWIKAWKNNPEGDSPRLNLSLKEENLEKLFDEIYKWDEGHEIK